jgi:hypothetical protein
MLRKTHENPEAVGATVQQAVAFPRRAAGRKPFRYIERNSQFRLPLQLMAKKASHVHPQFHFPAHTFPPPPAFVRCLRRLPPFSPRICDDFLFVKCKQLLFRGIAAMHSFQSPQLWSASQNAAQTATSPKTTPDLPSAYSNQEYGPMMMCPVMMPSHWFGQRSIAAQSALNYLARQSARQLCSQRGYPPAPSSR